MSEQAPYIATESAIAPALAATATGSVSLEARVPGSVTSVTYIPSAAITGADTNTRTLSLINRGQDGTGTTVIASLTLAAGVNLAAYDERTVTLAAAAADRTVAEGDVLEFRSASAGTGLADPGGRVEVAVARG